MGKSITKKITAIFTAAAFILSVCVCMTVEKTALAEDSYELGDVIACKTFGTESNDKTTGDGVTSKNVYLRGSYVEQGAAKYYLYNDSSRIGDNNWIRLNQAYSYDGNFASLNSHMLCIDTTSEKFSGKNFYSKSTDMRGSLEIGTRSGLFDTSKLSTTMTYMVDVKYQTAFSAASFVISTKTAGDRKISAVKIDNNGKLFSGASTCDEEIGELELDKKYTIGIVIKLIPAETSGKYTFEKAVYLDGAILDTYTNDTEIDAIGTLCRFDIDFTPWTSENFSDYSALGTDKNYYHYNDSLCGKPAANNIRRKYTIVPTRIEFDNFYVYAGDMYGDVMKTYTSLENITVTDGETLPDGIGDATIAWESLDENVEVDSSGVVGLVDEDSFYGYSTTAKLKATISNENNGETKTKTVDVSILRNTDDWSEQDFVDYDAQMPFSYLTYQENTMVFSDIALPRESVSGSTLTWTVSQNDAAKIQAGGEGATEDTLVISPQSGKAVKFVLTMSVSREGAETKKASYEITAIKAGYNSDEVYTWEEPLVAGSYKSETHIENESIIKTDTTWPFTDDASGIIPASVDVRPVITVGPFDAPIYGYEVDAALQQVGGNVAKDYEFYASEDGTDWDEIPSYYVTQAAKKIAVSATATYTVIDHLFSPVELDVSKNYRYLKIRLGDASFSGRYPATAALDGIKVHFETDVTKAYNALTFDKLTTQNIDAVKESLTNVPTADDDYGVSIVWESSDEDVLSSITGVVDTSKFYGYSIPVKLTATLSKTPETVVGGVARTKEFDITVVRDTDDWSAQDYVNYDVLYHDDKECLTFDDFTAQPENMVATSIHLPRELEGGGSFTWKVTDSSGNPTTAAQINNYILSFTPQKMEVTPLKLTVTSTKDTATASRTFDIELVRGFSDNLLLNAKKISATSSGINKALSRDVATFWETTPEDSAKTVTVEFSDITKINSGLIVENGANISGIEILTSEDGASYKNVYTGASNGDKVREAFSFPEVECKYVKIKFNSENPVSLYTLELYYEIITDEQIISYGLDDIKIPLTTSTSITLPTVGKYGGTIEWTTSDANVITNTGVITQAVNENKSATLTAVLSYNGTSSEPKTFTITVSGKIEIGGGNGGSGGSGGGGGASGGSVGAKEFEETIKESTQASSTASFADVSQSHWAHSYITELTASGVISKAYNYRPSDKVTREEFVKLIIAATGGINSDTQSQGFTDTDNTAWYYPYITAAHDRGIVTGNIDGSFGIGTTITRQDAAAMLYRAIENKNTHDAAMTFTDGTVVSVYAAEAITYLANEGILNGYEDGSFRPFDNLTRAESAKIIYMLSTLTKEDSNAK